jgi:hypothetical protein
MVIGILKSTCNFDSPIKYISKAGVTPRTVNISRAVPSILMDAAPGLAVQ